MTIQYVCVCNGRLQALQNGKDVEEERKDSEAVVAAECVEADQF